eukprot:1243147-Rhodomonas_salina.2
MARNSYVGQNTKSVRERRVQNASTPLPKIGHRIIRVGTDRPIASPYEIQILGAPGTEGTCELVSKVSAEEGNLRTR